MIPRSRWAVASVVAVALVTAGVGVIAAVHHDDGNACSYDTRVKAVSHLQSPAQLKHADDKHFDKLVASVPAMGPPFGSVRAGLADGRYPDLHLFPAGDGILAFEKDMSSIGGFSPLTYLDGTSLKPRWAIKPSSPRFQSALTRDRLLTFNPTVSATNVTSYDLASGKSVWCATLPIALMQSDLLATATLDDGDVVVEMGHAGPQAVIRTVELWLLSQKTGVVRWHREVAGAGHGDFVGQLDASMVLIGGSAAHELLPQGEVEGGAPIKAPHLRSPAGPVLTAVGSSDGKLKWSYDPGRNVVVHVIGVADGHPILLALTRSGPKLIALSSTGQELWRRTPLMTPFVEASLHNGVVITRTLTGGLRPAEAFGGPINLLHGYDAATGALLWSKPLLPDRAQPTAFTLDEIPALDADHLLVPTSKGLNVLDLRTGTNVASPWPVDPDRQFGAVSSYAPEHALVTDHLLGILTYSGVVIVDRER